MWYACGEVLGLGRVPKVILPEKSAKWVVLLSEKLKFSAVENQIALAIQLRGGKELSKSVKARHRPYETLPKKVQLFYQLIPLFSGIQEVVTGRIAIHFCFPYQYLWISSTELKVGLNLRHPGESVGRSVRKKIKEKSRFSPWCEVIRSGNCCGKELHV